MIERGLLPDFLPAVLTEIEAIGQAASERDASIRDLRGLLWASIDNDDSRDLDQLSVAEVLPGGAVKILVAIADVDGLVKTGSAIDGHAQHNTTSCATASGRRSHGATLFRATSFASPRAAVSRPTRVCSRREISTSSRPR